MEYKSSYLIHYGVPGMRWGYRRKKISSANEGSTVHKKASLSEIKKSDNKTEAFTNNRPPKKLSEKQIQNSKKVLAAAGTITLAAVAAYGIKKRRERKITDNLRYTLRNLQRMSYTS